MLGVGREPDRGVGERCESDADPEQHDGHDQCGWPRPFGDDVVGSADDRDEHRTAEPGGDDRPANHGPGRASVQPVGEDSRQRDDQKPQPHGARDAAERETCKATIAELCAEAGQSLLGWRQVPVDNSGSDLGPTAMAAQPHIEQLFIGAADGVGKSDKDKS